MIERHWLSALVLMCFTVPLPASEITPNFPQSKPSASQFENTFSAPQAVKAESVLQRSGPSRGLGRFLPQELVVETGVPVSALVKKGASLGDEAPASGFSRIVAKVKDWRTREALTPDYFSRHRFEVLLEELNKPNIPIHVQMAALDTIIFFLVKNPGLAQMSYMLDLLQYYRGEHARTNASIDATRRALMVMARYSPGIEGELVVKGIFSASEFRESRRLFARALGSERLAPRGLDPIEHPVNIFVAAEDYEKQFSSEQRHELFVFAARNPEMVSVVIYGSSETAYAELELKNVRVSRESDLAALKLVRPAQTIHLSRRFAPAQGMSEVLGEKFGKFRYQSNEEGLLGVALLYAQSEDKKAFVAQWGLKQNAGGFFFAAVELLEGIVQGFEASLTTGRAA